MSSAIDSAYDSPHTTENCDPIIFGDSSPYDDVDFSNLFAADNSFTHDTPLVKDGLTAPHIIDHPDFAFNGNDFTFDSMVDFDADESTPNDQDLAYHDSDRYHLTANSLAIPSDSPTQIDAASSAQQPFLGASI